MERWKSISPSQYPWEQDALDFIARALPNREPFRAFSNFEFIAEDGSINEVDLLLIGRYSLFLVEIKSRPGEVDGDAHTWVWRDGTRSYYADNPLLLTNRKAKKLASLLRQQLAGSKKRTPFIQSLVFLSDPSQRLKLNGPASENVHLRAHIAHRLFDESAPATNAQVIDRDLATALTRALEAIGIRPPQQARRVGDYQLQKVLAETDYHQDWLAQHVSLSNTQRRVRLYTAKRALGAKERAVLADAARREFQLLQGVRHPGILPAADFIDSEHGPALLFDYDPEIQRLDQFLALEGNKLDSWQRLKLVRAIAEVLDAAHRNHLFHRGLAPQTILVRAKPGGSFDVTLFDWQIATRQLQESETISTGTLHVEMLSDRATQAIYLAPEARTAPRPAAIKLDLFALGAIAYFILTGEAPAINGDELLSKCEPHGLLLSSVLNGCLAELEELVQFATMPAPEDRFGDVGEFMLALDKAEEALEEQWTAPEAQMNSPLEASAGSQLPGGFEVVRRLGKGGTSLALEVKRKSTGPDLSGVLKIALDADYNPRLQREAETLAQLQPHPHIVQCLDRTEIGGLTALFLSSAGDETLAERLRQEGRLGLDLLQRFGEELILVVGYLEQCGIAHRDIKPDNIGIRPGSNKRLMLVLFDFSLAGVAATDINAGTRLYIDPFLRKRGQWDGYAERYATALTMYEMAAGKLPEWGDGSADPATLKCEVTLDQLRFESSIQQSAVAFFKRALARDYKQRFDHAEQMLEAWSKVFERVTRPATLHPTDHASAGEGITPDTPLESLPELGPRHLELIYDKIGRDQLANAGDLAEFPRNRFYRHRGIALAVARELHQLADSLRARFGGALNKEELPPASVVAKLPIDSAADLLLPKKGDTAALASWLGLSNDASPAALLPEQLQTLKERLSRQPEIGPLRDEIVVILAGLGGIATMEELASVLLARRGSVQTGSARQIQALAVTRAALLHESGLDGARWQVVDADNLAWAPSNPLAANALVLGTTAASGASGLFPAPPGQRAAWARELGRVADQLAQQEPLPSSQQVQERLARVSPPAGDTTLSGERLIRLAAACASEAALSSRMEFYPRNMPAARALKLAVSSLFGLRQFDLETIRRRIYVRYPLAEPLPAQTELESLLRQAGLEVRWDGARRVFETLVAKNTISGTTQITRFPTNRPLVSTAPDIGTALQLDERIASALRQGKLLTLGVTPKEYLPAQKELQRRYGLQLIDFDALVLRHLRAQAQEWEIDWHLLLAADAAPPGSIDSQNFAMVRNAIWPKLEAELLTGSTPALLVNLGLLARWQQMTLFSRLQEACLFNRRAALVALVASQLTPDNRPLLDGQAVPVAINTTDYGRIPRAWVENAHRNAPSYKDKMQ